MDTLWQKSLFRRLLVAVLSVSFAMGLMAVLRALMPAWQSDYVVLLLFAAALEGIYTTELMVQPEWRWRRTVGFRLGELLTILIVVRVATWLATGQLPTPAHIGRWLRSPGSFFDVGFLIVGFSTSPGCAGGLWNVKDAGRLHRDRTHIWRVVFLFFVFGQERRGAQSTEDVGAAGR